MPGAQPPKHDTLVSPLLSAKRRIKNLQLNLALNAQARSQKLDKDEAIPSPYLLSPLPLPFLLSPVNGAVRSGYRSDRRIVVRSTARYES